MDLPHASAKQLFKDLWSNKPVFFTVLAIVAIGLYLLWKNTGSSVFTAPTSTNTPTSPTGIPLGNFYTYNTSITETNTNPSQGPKPPVPFPWPKPPPPPPKPPDKIQTVFPAPKGSLHPSPPGAGNGDTNFWVWTITPNQTLASATKFAKWNSISQLVSYRNNRDIFTQMGIDVTNGNAPLLAGWQISV